MDYLELLLIYLRQYISITLFILAILFVIRFYRRQRLNFDGHWHTMIEGFTYSPQEFYKQVQLSLVENSIDSLYIKSIELRTGGLFSKKRLYLRIEWNSYIFDVSCTNIANSTFISWYMKKSMSINQIVLSIIPIIGPFLAKRLFPVTYYTIDMENMFVTYAQNSVLKVVKEITENTNVRPLTEVEKKPIMKDIFKR